MLIVFIDVCSLSVGIETTGGLMTKLTTHYNGDPTEQVQMYAQYHCVLTYILTLF